MSRFEMTQHATERALDMAVDAEEIRAVLERPRHRQHDAAGREVWTRGRVAVVVRAEQHRWVVITVMWATANAWALDRETVASRGTESDQATSRRMRGAIRARKKGRQKW